MEAYLNSGGHILMTHWIMENMIKHDGFREEQEWRVVVPDPPTSLMSFHPTLAGVKASVDISNPLGDGKLPLMEIVYGPTLRKDTDIVIRWMLDKYGYSAVAADPLG